MNDRQMRNLIRQSAEDVEVPERLKPDKIVDLIQAAGEAPKDVVDAGRMLTNKNRRNFYTGYAVTAAVILAAMSGLSIIRWIRSAQVLWSP